MCFAYCSRGRWCWWWRRGRGWNGASQSCQRFKFKRLMVGSRLAGHGPAGQGPAGSLPEEGTAAAYGGMAGHIMLALGFGWAGLGWARHRPPLRSERANLSGVCQSGLRGRAAGPGAAFSARHKKFTRQVRPPGHKRYDRYIPHLRWNCPCPHFAAYENFSFIWDPQ